MKEQKIELKVKKLLRCWLIVDLDWQLAFSDLDTEFEKCWELERREWLREERYGEMKGEFFDRVLR